MTMSIMPISMASGRQNVSFGTNPFRAGGLLARGEREVADSFHLRTRQGGESGTAPGKGSDRDNPDDWATWNDKAK